MGSSSSSSSSSSSPPSSPPPPPSYSKYGDIRKVKTIGASDVTASADNLPYSGVAASEAMAKHDSGPMEDYEDIINRVAREKDIHPALIAAIISRESRAGEAIKDSRPEPGWGDWREDEGIYRAFGLMQIDEKNSGVKPDGEWDSVKHLLQATQMLVDHICVIQRKNICEDWSKEEQLKGGIAAYNMGDQKVTSKNVDQHTTSKDYANDVVARAHWFIKNGYN